MPHRPTKKQPRYTDYEFVEILLPDGSEEAIKELAASPELLLTHLDAMTSDDYKISVTYNDVLEGFNATATGKQSQPENALFILSALAPTPAEALAVLFYKHYDVAKRGAWMLVAHTRDKKVYR